ncbi:MAG: 16S rRNA (cytidine(1402)-2'-O)-methyltransferase [Hydrotalea sp.]|nr:16S rRNA (cytidine(1402)-2'-O)-methyltransferase [Hydrotalea sp.]
MPLYLVATPIGNLDDLTPRALALLRDADLVLCENPRHSQKLFAHYGLRKKTMQVNDHNEKNAIASIMAQLQANKNIAMISDGGTPLVSDPGFPLVRVASAAGIKIVPVPGASAVLTALVASGLPMNVFSFFGFPPPKTSARADFWQAVSRPGLGCAVIFLPPHKAETYLSELATAYPERLACLAREMTKIHEEYITRPLAQLLATCQHKKNWRGEMVLVLAEMAEEEQQTVAKELLTLYKEKNLSMRDALTKTIALTRESHNRLYDIALKIWKK